MFILGSKDLKSVLKSIKPEDEDYFEIIDTEDGIIEVYPWVECRKIARDLPNLYGIIAGRAKLVAVSSAFGDSIRCDYDKVFYCGKELFNLRVQGLMIYVLDKDTVAVNMMCQYSEFLDGIRICRVQYLSGAYRVWFHILCQVESEKCEDHEVVLDTVIQDNGTWSINGVFDWSGFVTQSQIREKYRTNISLAQFLQIYDERRP